LVNLVKLLTIVNFFAAYGVTVMSKQLFSRDKKSAPMWE